jgi:hypothetical protein
MARIDDLKAARDLWQAKIDAAASDANAAGAKPNGPGGVDHQGFLKECQARVDWYNQQIALEEGPQEFTSTGFST